MTAKKRDPQSDVGGLLETERSFAAGKRTGAGKPRGAHRPASGGGNDPHTERNLDHALEATFPASDPVSIHPGAD